MIELTEAEWKVLHHWQGVAAVGTYYEHANVLGGILTRDLLSRGKVAEAEAALNNNPKGN